MVPSLSPEFSLAAACAMWPPSDRRTEAIRIAATGPLDWARFLRVVRRHHVLGLVHDGLTRAQPEVPPEIVRQIGAQAATLVHENLAMAGEAVRLQRLFDDAGLPVLFLKGSSLAVLAYGNLGLRRCKDIDLLVSRETLRPAIALIERAGYRRFDPPPGISDAQLQLLMSLRKDIDFVHKETGLRLDLHWQLFLNPHAMDAVSVWAASRVVPLTGKMGLRTLGQEDLFTYLCVHGALITWRSLKWLADIGALLATEPEGGAARLYSAAEARGAGGAAAQAMLLCQRIFGTPLAAPLMTTLRSSPESRWLEQAALLTMTAGHGEQEPLYARFGTTIGSLSAFLLRKSWRYRLAEFRNLVTNQADVLAVPLPERFRFLYPIMRLPLWVWRHASRRKSEELRITGSHHKMRSRYLRIVNEVETEILRRDHRTEYFAALRSGYVDDLMRIDRLHQGGTMLEIGGYPFCFSMCLWKLGVDLTTVDLAPQRAQDLIREQCLRVVACDIERGPLPFKDRSVATIVFCATFEHLRVDPIFALEEMRRVLQPGGLLYLVTPNLYRLGNVVSFALGRGLAFDPIHKYGKLRRRGHMGHVREYTASEIRRFLAGAGFTTVEVSTRAAPSRRGKLVDAVHRLLPGVRTELVVTAKSPLSPTR